MARKKRKLKLHSFDNNQEAIKAHSEKETKKTFSLKDLSNIHPLTISQREVFEHFHYGNSLLLKGTAGTGKTFLAMYFALKEVFDKNTPYKKVVVVRSTTPVKDMGHLPGDIDEKTAIFELPFQSICDDLFEFKKSYDNMKKAGIIEFIPTNYIRGITLHDSIVIVDEYQSAEWNELYAIMTRAGQHTKYYVCGDTKQCDLKYEDQQSGHKRLERILRDMPDFGIVDFNSDDIVRSEFVKNFIIASEE